MEEASDGLLYQGDLPHLKGLSVVIPKVGFSVAKHIYTIKNASLWKGACCFKFIILCCHPSSKRFPLSGQGQATELFCSAWFAVQGERFMKQRRRVWHCTKRERVKKRAGGRKAGVTNGTCAMGVGETREEERDSPNHASQVYAILAFHLFLLFCSRMASHFLIFFIPLLFTRFSSPFFILRWILLYRKRRPMPTALADEDDRVLQANEAVRSSRRQRAAE